MAEVANLMEKTEVSETQKKMMILGASALQVPAIEKAKALGYRVILVDYDENAVGFALADEKLVVSTLDQEEVYRQAQRCQPDVVITSTSDGPVRTAAYVNEKLGKRPDLSYENALCATIKNKMRDRLKKYGVPIPRYYVTEDYAAFSDAVDRLDGHCIVKPADNAGSRGVVLLECERPSQELKKKTYEYSKNNSRNGTVLVEEYMQGPEVSVEAIVVDGEPHILTITDKYITPPPYFVELAHCEPSQLDGKTQEQIRQVAAQAIKAIGIENAPAHVEIKVTEEGPKIVELAARLGGDFITSKLVPLSTGIDMVGASVILATGKKPELEPKWQHGAAIHFIHAPEETQGALAGITVPETLYGKEGVEEIVIYKKPGDAVCGTRSSNDRLGHVITVGATVEEAMKRGEQILSQIRVEITPAGEKTEKEK